MEVPLHLLCSANFVIHGIILDNSLHAVVHVILNFNSISIILDNNLYMCR